MRGESGKSGKISIEIVLSHEISWLHAHCKMPRKILTSVKYFIKKVFVVAKRAVVMGTE